MNCATKVRFFCPTFGVSTEGPLFLSFLVLRLHKKALIPRLFLLYVDAPYRDRTCDPRIKSPLLCQLS